MIRLVLPICCCLTIAPLVASASGPLTGRMEGDIYVSATGEFQLRSPVLPELGGRINDSESVVTFQDDYGTHISIGCFALDATQRWELDTRGRRDYLLYFFTEFVMANFNARFPGSKIESARYLANFMDGSLIALSLLPGGSNFEDQSLLFGSPSAGPVVAKRGTLLFLRSRRVYVVSTELAERATQRSTYRQTVEQENELLATRLTALAGRITFTRDQPRQP